MGGNQGRNTRGREQQMRAPAERIFPGNFPIRSKVDCRKESCEVGIPPSGDHFVGTCVGDSPYPFTNPPSFLSNIYGLWLGYVFPPFFLVWLTIHDPPPAYVTHRGLASRRAGHLGGTHALPPYLLRYDYPNGYSAGHPSAVAYMVCLQCRITLFITRPHTREGCIGACVAMAVDSFFLPPTLCANSPKAECLELMHVTICLFSVYINDYASSEGVLMAVTFY